MNKKPQLIPLLAFCPKLREADFARRRAHDWRTALLLIQPVSCNSQSFG